jgi:phosphatidylinositol alpha 1,6-mannosyltransferase
MKIAFFSEVFLPKVDGIVNTLCHLLDHLTHSGVASLLIAPQGSPEYYNNTRIISAPAVPFPFYPEIKLASPWLNVDAELEAFRPDLIHILNPVALGLGGLRYARSHNIPLVASYHTDIPGFATRWGFGFLSGGLLSYLRWIHNQADLNLCPSRATQSELARQGYKRLRVWTRGVDTLKFSPSHATPEMRTRLTSGRGCSRLLIYVGRLSAEKRIDWLKDILLAHPGTHLAVVGDGPQRPQLEETFRNLPVTFTGYLRGQELSAAYASADVFVFPGANETFGNVALEGMASGLPVVAPRAGGMLDFIEDEHNGLLFDPENRSSLLEKTSRLIHDLPFAHRIALLGRRTAELRGWNSVLDGLVTQYSDLIQRGCASPTRQKLSSLRRVPGLSEIQS